MSNTRMIEVAVVSLALMALAPVMAAGGRCATVTIQEDLILPDGSQHAGGELTLCAIREYSPVATLHKTYVNGMAISMLLSQRGVSEGSPGEEPFMMFTKDGEGRMHLYGYSVPSRGRQVTYLLGRQFGDKTPRTTVITLEEKNSEPGTVLLANVR